MGSKQPNPVFNSPGNYYQGSCGPRVTWALILRDFGHLALPRNWFVSKVWKDVGNFNTQWLPFNHKQLGLTHLPHTFLDQNTTPSLLCLVPFDKMFVLGFQTSVCKWQIPSIIIAYDWVIMRKGDLLAQAQTNSEKACSALESHRFRDSNPIRALYVSLLLSAVRISFPQEGCLETLKTWPQATKGCPTYVFSREAKKKVFSRQL